ncbi:MAG: MFS transporter [Candidatus Nanopelagicales bacterium]|jgi:MFS family permease|nr:MFS transporter [Candidatus Nanopelagicales bacterium]
MTAAQVQRTYLTLVLGNTLAASLIWGINTLFLLDAGLSNAQAFAANAFFTLGMILFEIPTGVVADTAGRRRSYLLGTLTLAGSTLLYWGLWVVEGPFWGWALVSILLGLGFTFFSGAVDAWLVDALAASGFAGTLDSVFGRGQIVAGAAMLAGSIAGGVLAQASNLGVPFLLRAGILVVMFLVASAVMRDLGFTPAEGLGVRASVRRTLRASVHHGLGSPPVRWVMLAAPLQAGVGIYAFYALQPLLLQLWGDPSAYAIAGAAAAVVAGSQIVGGLLAAPLTARVARRTTVLIVCGVGAAALLVGVGVAGAAGTFWAVLALAAGWALLGAVATPVQSAYLNGMIPSQQRATVLSFASLMGSGGGVVVQPALGRVADAAGYPASLVVGGIIQVLAAPLLALSRRAGHPADRTALARGAPPA